MRHRFFFVALSVAAGALACSSGDSSTSSSSSSGTSGDPTSDAAVSVDGSLKDGATGDGGVSLPERFKLTIEGVNVPIDQTSATVESSLEGGAWKTKLRARILDPEKYSWNADKATPAYVQLDDIQLESVAHPTGDIRCVRSIKDLQYTIISIATTNDKPLKSTDASCTAQVDTWTDGVAYRGSAKGFMSGSGTYAFTVAWNVTK